MFQDFDLSSKQGDGTKLQTMEQTAIQKHTIAAIWFIQFESLDVFQICVGVLGFSLSFPKYEINILR